LSYDVSRLSLKATQMETTNALSAPMIAPISAKVGTMITAQLWFPLLSGAPPRPNIIPAPTPPIKPPTAA